MRDLRVRMRASDKRITIGQVVYHISVFPNIYTVNTVNLMSFTIAVKLTTV